ncbi:BTB/POZ and MATH domain-containing protein 3-like [Aegilops tauschii subsp. strangulata]|uniref:BTB/POZ and MATH domain-containing protein 3-like n=1 Tax=Aegilops tauschii subsp. strangulata TaxID=200361 RepID=UPI000989E956|nr:BTB/POZ and MATH domain-containing protein 3-like [Aegilops tauschii subsp. strangulata]
MSPCYAPVPSDDLPRQHADASASTVAATAVGTGHHILRVEGYSHLKTMHGGYLESTAFMAAGHAWRARRRDADADQRVVHAEYEFALVHHQGTLVKWPSHCEHGTASAFDKGNSWGCPFFIATEELKRSRFLKDDCFAVRCKVTVVQVQEWAVQEDPRPAETETTPWKAFARFCGSICG